jgi:mono/diheme cytochrome c family protein
VRRLLPITLLVLLGLATWAQTRTPLPRSVRAVPRDAGREAAPQPGRRVYEQYGCALCHGADGKGGFINHNSETEGKVPGVIYVAEGFTPAELKGKILDGLATVGRADPKGPRPPYRMPGWRGQMTPQEVDDLAQYLISLYPKSAEEKWR